MDNETFTSAWWKMIPGDPNFRSSMDAIEAGDLTAAFEAAHAQGLGRQICP
jgi:hypothetical protein